jgi:hypothetical protein
MKRQSGNKARSGRPERRDVGSSRAVDGHYAQRSAAGPPLTEPARSDHDIVRRNTVSEKSSNAPQPLPPGETRPDLDDDEAGWGMTKVSPHRSGLPMAVWVTPDDGYPHDVRIKVATIYGGRGSWRSDAVPIAIGPEVRQVAGQPLSAGDLSLVQRWVDLNRQTIIDLWEGRIDSDPDELLPVLQKLPS